MNLGTFQHALVANPADELTWLALADWLEEAGDARAELVRAWLRRDERRVCELVAAGHVLPLPELENSIGMRFVLVPPGPFLMGSPADEEGRYADETQHRVTLTRPFWIGVFPVTRRQYLLLTPAGPGAGPGHPVARLTFAEMEAFCVALSELRDEIRASHRYRLPTEAEWEYACRGAGVHTTPFSFGASLSSRQANFDGTKPYGGAGRGPSRQETTPVGSFPPNVLGLYDLHGNVWEMCSDYYSEGVSTEAVTDPAGPCEGRHRVLRGGAFASGSIGCRAAHRGMGSEVGSDADTGFRVVLEWRP